MANPLCRGRDMFCRPDAESRPFHSNGANFDQTRRKFQRETPEGVKQPEKKSILQWRPYKRRLYRKQVEKIFDQSTQYDRATTPGGKRPNRLSLRHLPNLSEWEGWREGRFCPLDEEGASRSPRPRSLRPRPAGSWVGGGGAINLCCEASCYTKIEETNQSERVGNKPKVALRRGRKRRRKDRDIPCKKKNR